MTTDQAALDALQAGSQTPVLGICELPECCSCPHQEHGQACDMCRHNPEPDANLEVQRRIHWLREALYEIEEADKQRIADGRPLDDAAFLIATTAASNDINDDCERLITVLDGAADAQQLSGELGVGHVMGGGQ